MTNSKAEELLFLPLGGAGEIGMNLNLYGYGPPGDHTWVMVDLGVTFSDGEVPGIDVIMPDPGFIVERRDKLAGLVLTHAHEDHLGAVPYLWPQLRCPIYATPFTISILERKLSEEGLGDAVEIIEVPLGGRFDVGPFDMELIALTHSIPEPNAIAIRTPVGTVLHTGDWKFDPDPVVGATSDEAALRQLGDDGVLAIVCDSTNVFNPGESGSEADLLESLTSIIGQCENRVAVACFASNVARLQTIAEAARSNDRDVVLAGRSLTRIVTAARENGYLEDVPAFLDEEDADHLPRDKVVIICTGSQGEPRAALSRIAADNHPRVHLEAGDSVVFSSRMIPGNEASIARLQNQLARRSINVITERDRFVHVSGHPARDELAKMYQLVRPGISIPVHGEDRHLIEHAKLARECQVSQAIVVENGAMVRLDPSEAGTIDHVPTGRMVLDGNRVVPIHSESVRGRVRALWNGTAVATIVIDGEGNLAAEPRITTNGLVDSDDDPAIEEACEAARKALDELSPSQRCDDEAATESLRIAIRRSFRESLAKRPITTVHLVRI